MIHFQGRRTAVVKVEREVLVDIDSCLERDADYIT